MQLQCLAEMVHHSCDLKYVIDTHPYHPFASIHIFMLPALLAELRRIATKQRSERIRMPTGIQLHVESIIKLEELVNERKKKD